MRLMVLSAAMALAAAGPALAQPAAPAAPPPPGYSAFGAPPPTGPSPGLSVREFAPGAGKTYKLSFKAGDDVMGGMMRFAAAHPMQQAQLSGVGGTLSAVLAWYDPKARAFKRIAVNEKCEISGVTGTITTDAQGKPNVHLHLVLTRSDGSTVSGHLIRRPSTRSWRCSSPTSDRARTSPSRKGQKNSAASAGAGRPLDHGICEMDGDGADGRRGDLRGGERRRQASGQGRRRQDHRGAARRGMAGPRAQLRRAALQPLDKVNRATVKDLGLAWHYDFGERQGLESTPIVHDGVIYVTTDFSEVWAFDARSGKKLWSYVPGTHAWQINTCCSPANRGVAIWGDKVFVGALDGRLIALNAKTGKLVWSTQTFPKSTRLSITGAPR